MTTSVYVVVQQNNPLCYYCTYNIYIIIMIIIIIMQFHTQNSISKLVNSICNCWI